MPIIKTNILIIGAGPAGTSAALFLAKKGISCTLVDKASFPRDKICGDALSGKVVEVLNKLNTDYAEELNIHPQFLGSWGVTFVAPNGQSLRIPFKNSTTKNDKAPGFIAKRIDFDNWLFSKAKAHSTIEIIENCELRKFEPTTDAINAYSTSGTQLIAKLVIACDGAYSTFSKNVAGLQTEPAHNCFGLRAYYKNVNGLDAENFIELHFLKNMLPGYFWIFPLPNGYANIGIGMRADKMSARKINLKKAFEHVLSKSPSIKKRFENATLQGEVKLFGLPLGSKKRNISGNHYLLCGDAAQLIDPFTGEGIGNAMLSGMFAAQQAEQCLAHNNFSAKFNQQYDANLYNRLWNELLLSYRMQQLVNYPSLFNFIVRKANNNTLLRETISCMFDDLNLRSHLKNPLFYFKLLFS